MGGQKIQADTAAAVDPETSQNIQLPTYVGANYWAETLVYTDKKLKFDLCDLEK